MKATSRIICGFVIFAMNPAGVGFTTGWLVGVSPTPAVGAVLPLIFGLLGMLGIGATARVLRSASLEPKGSRKNSQPDPWGDQLQLFGFLALSCICFCIPFYVGTYNGIWTRVPMYPAPQLAFEGLSIRADELAALENFRSVARSKHIPVADYQATVQDVFVPIVKRHPVFDGMQSSDPRSILRHRVFFNAFDEIMRFNESPKRPKDDAESNQMSSMSAPPPAPAE